MRNYKMMELRERKGLTHEELAKLVGVTRQTICGIEGGRLNPTIKLVYRNPSQ